MVSKILFVVLIGCAVTFASPINGGVKHSTQNSLTEEAAKISADIKEFIKRLFGEFIGKIGEVIKKSLGENINIFKVQFNTKEYKEAIKILEETVQKLEEYKDKPQNENETKELLEKESEIGEAFVKLINEAANNISQNNGEKVHAEDFKKIAEEFKQLVDKYL